MPKLKTHKGAQARFKVTPTGKILRVKGPKSHFRRRKAYRVKKLFDTTIPLNRADRKRVTRLIPYGA